ncbi:DUF4142 domain-containing protein [Lysobacter arvi]|uniref:DUF4142 domain-containing protein n=1 Tax=Lysobacter arvi TaxID=3038776 RepID=A0ABU1CDP6_9GAMM|nr:DUF4142 domain-containing protein [Lysobacter arvi]MDR0182167.1 DUF4142 domain-containing protein [Lysobacter arvi]
MNRAMKLSLAISIAMLALSGCNRDENEANPDSTALSGPTANAPDPTEKPADTADTAATAGTTGDATNATAAMDPNAAPGTPNAPATGALTQADAVGLVGAVDKHEIAAAEQAKSKKVTGDVAEYANMLHREHSRNLDAGKKLNPNEGNPEVTAMEEKGRSELSMLDQKSGKDYEKAYVDAMVKGHQEALSLIDNRLLPAAQDANVRTFLTNSREHVAMHLERGKTLQQKMGGAAP